MDSTHGHDETEKGNVTIPVLYEDGDFLVVDKPAGIVVNRSDTSGEETVQEWVEERIRVNRLKGQQVSKKQKTSSLPACQPANLLTFLQRSGMVHRLDKETSGCLIIAKTPEAFVELQRQFKAREVQKEYIALVYGRVESKEGTIRVPLARSRYDRQKFAVVAGGRDAETGYEVLQMFKVFKGPALPMQGRALSDSRFTLLRLFPKTGRTHQIRVHLTYVGHPIVSDQTYAGDDRAREDRQWCPRLFLHAEAIAFTHPSDQRPMRVTSPLPGDLTRALKLLSAV